MKPPLRQGSSNDFQTPPEAIIPLLPHLPEEWTIWECAAGYGYLSRALLERGYGVISSDIIYDPSQDFLTWEPTSPWDCIITNPPYAMKQQFLERAYSLHKPFALLLPLTTLETRKRQDLFATYGVEIIFFDKRINFVTPSKRGSGAWFAVAWFTWGLRIGQQLTFISLPR